VVRGLRGERFAATEHERLAATVLVGSLTAEPPLATPFAVGRVSVVVAFLPVPVWMLRPLGWWRAGGAEC